MDSRLNQHEQSSGALGEARATVPRLPPLGKRPGVIEPLACSTEVSGYLVGSAAFKAVGTGDPRPAGSIPVHLRHKAAGQRSRRSCPRPGTWRGCVARASGPR